MASMPLATLSLYRSWLAGPRDAKWAAERFAQPKIFDAPSKLLFGLKFRPATRRVAAYLKRVSQQERVDPANRPDGP